MDFRRAFQTPLLVTAALSCVLASMPAARANEITNPSFENGLTGWTNNTKFAWTSSTQHATFGSYDARNGAGYNCGSTNCLDATQGAYLYQDFSTTAGDTYTISFDYYFGGTSGLQEINVYFGSTLAADISTTSNSPAWTNYSFNAVATASTTRLEFTQVNLPDYTYLDNVSATLDSVPTPEPGSCAMLAIGIAACASLRRRVHKIRSYPGGSPGPRRR